MKIKHTGQKVFSLFAALMMAFPTGLNEQTDQEIKPEIIEETDIENIEVESQAMPAEANDRQVEMIAEEPEQEISYPAFRQSNQSAMEQLQYLLKNVIRIGEYDRCHHL